MAADLPCGLRARGGGGALWEIREHSILSASSSPTRTITSRPYERSTSPSAPTAAFELPGTEKDWPADLVILAMGFRHEHDITASASISTRATTPRRAPRATTPHLGSRRFAAKDCRRGQSLVVWAINEELNRRLVDRWLKEAANASAGEALLRRAAERRTALLTQDSVARGLSSSHKIRTRYALCMRAEEREGRPGGRKRERERERLHGARDGS